MAEGKDDGADDTPRTRDPRSYDSTTGGGHGGDDHDEDHPEHGGGKPKRKGLLQRPVTLVVMAVVIVVLLVLAILYWLHARNYQSTDDAFIDTHIVRVAPRISGQVQQVLVNDNQIVRAGETLVQIDSHDQEATRDQAEAQKAQAEAQIAQAQAQLVQIAAQVRVSRATYTQDLAVVNSNQAQATNAARDYARYVTLKGVNPQAVSQQQLDQSESQARSTAAQTTAAARQAAAAAEQIRATAAQEAGARAQIAAGEAQVKNAEATIRSADLNIGYTTIKAPEDGIVTQRSVAVGNYLSAGTQIMALVPTHLWVTANFKETQLELMRAGQPVEIKVDACPHAKVDGHLDSIQRGSGQAFGLLPPENATGNYVKVVQRVPVKILIDHAPRECPLGPGLSVNPKVKVR